MKDYRDMTNAEMDAEIRANVRVCVRLATVLGITTIASAGAAISCSEGHIYSGLAMCFGAAILLGIYTHFED